MNATKQTQKSAIEANVEIRDEPSTVEICHTVLTLSFANGETLVVDTTKLPPNILSHAIAHGLKQKLVDAAAISRDPATGRPATIATKYAAVAEVYERLHVGDWNKRREGGAGTQGGLLYRALVRMYDGRKTPDQIKEYLDGKSDKEKAALRKNPTVAKHIDDIRNEDGGETGDDLLAELEG